MAEIRKGAVSFKGNPADLAGPEIKVGQKAPDFVVQGADLSNVTLASSAGQTRVFATVPSLDTSVCSLESKKFNDEAAKLEGTVVYVVSMDLPFAQKRWCGAEGADKIKAVSDHRSASFGAGYGVLLPSGPLERCLTRAVFVVGPDDVVKHVEYVAEITKEPDYAAAIAAAKG